MKKFLRSRGVKVPAKVVLKCPIPWTNELGRFLDLVVLDMHVDMFTSSDPSCEIGGPGKRYV